MKEILDYKEFCKENGISEMLPQSRNAYKLYSDKCVIENRSHINEMREKAKEFLKEVSNKK